MTLNEGINLVWSYLNDSAFMANFSLVAFVIYDFIRKMKIKKMGGVGVTNTTILGEVVELKQAIKEQKEENEILKKMFVTAFNNSKLDSATKFKLSELAVSSGNIVKDLAKSVGVAKSIDLKEDIVEPIKEQITKKIENATDSGKDLLEVLKDKLNNV